MGGNMGGGSSSGGSSGQASGDWWGMQSKEDYEAYLKWCEENKMRQAEQAKQKELLEMYQKAEEGRKMEMEKMRVEKEAKERHDNMMAQWASWQKKLKMQSEFEGLGEEIMELKHKYMYMVTCEFLKFCKCSDFSADLERYFQHDGFTYAHEEWDLEDLEGIDGTDPVAVAQAIANKPEIYQIKAFFGGLAESMCGGARAYVEQLQQWEKTYNFMERLM